jgi:hypothetical protein
LINQRLDGLLTAPEAGSAPAQVSTQAPSPTQVCPSTPSPAPVCCSAGPSPVPASSSASAPAPIEAPSSSTGAGQTKSMGIMQRIYSFCTDREASIDQILEAMKPYYPGKDEVALRNHIGVVVTTYKDRFKRVARGTYTSIVPPTPPQPQIPQDQQNQPPQAQS